MDKSQNQGSSKSYDLDEVETPKGGNILSDIKDISSELNQKVKRSATKEEEQKKKDDDNQENQVFIITEKLDTALEKSSKAKYLLVIPILTIAFFTYKRFKNG